MYLLINIKFYFFIILAISFIICLIYITSFQKYNNLTEIKSPNEIKNVNYTIIQKASQTKTKMLKNSLFKMNPLNLCKNQTVILFSYVFISIKSIEKRKIIRETWGNRNNFDELRVGFVVGLSVDYHVNELVKKENDLYGDIIQGDFIDSYRNLSFKSITAWKWISMYCQNANFVLKIDDDVVAQTFNLKKFLNEIQQKNFMKTFHCYAWHNAEVIRDPSSKFYVSLSEYSKKTFDTYCSGIAYIMTNDIFREMYIESRKFPVFWIDDVYVGMVAKLLNVFYKQIPSYYIDYNQRNSDSFYLFIQNVDSNKDYQLVWNLIAKKQNKS